MQLFFLFAYGMIVTLLEIHMNSFNVPHIAVSLTFVSGSITYLIISLTSGKIFKGFDERSLMVIGILVLCLSYLMMAPWSLIFPHELGLVIAGVPVLSFGQSLTYSLV